MVPKAVANLSRSKETQPKKCTQIVKEPSFASINVMNENYTAVNRLSDPETGDLSGVGMQIKSNA